MPYSSERIVTVASVKLTEQESALISAWCKLAGTKVEAIASDLMKFFIHHHVQLELLSTPQQSEMVDIIQDFSDDVIENNEQENL